MQAQYQSYIECNPSILLKGHTMTENVPHLRIRCLKDREIESVLTFIIKLLLEANLPSEVFTKLIGELVSLMQKFQMAINRQRKNELTADIRKADEERNKHFNTFLKGVEYFLSMSGTPMEEAAHLLRKVIDKYGKGIIRESNKVETVKLRSLLKDLHEANEAAALETLNMSATIDSLNSSNEYFDVLYLKRSAQEAEDDTPSLIPTRKEIAESLYLLVNLINFYNRIEPEVYGAFAGELAEIITDMMTVAKARQTRNAHEQESSVEEETPVGE